MPFHLTWLQSARKCSIFNLYFEAETYSISISFGSVPEASSRICHQVWLIELIYGNTFSILKWIEMSKFGMLNGQKFFRLKNSAAKQNEGITWNIRTSVTEALYGVQWRPLTTVSRHVRGARVLYFPPSLPRFLRQKWLAFVVSWAERWPCQLLPSLGGKRLIFGATLRMTGPEIGIPVYRYFFDGNGKGFFTSNAGNYR